MQVRAQVSNVGRLDTDQRSSLTRLVEAAHHTDGTAPLSESVLLAAGASSSKGSPHFLAYNGPHLTGYAHLERGLAGAGGEAATAEVVVDPGHRRQGIGTALVRALEDAVFSQPEPVAPQPEPVSGPEDAVSLQIWAHGHLGAARDFLTGMGYSSVRELNTMRRSLRPDASDLPDADPLPHVSLPDGFTTRRFAVGQDEDAWLRVNARAFAHHPEQGRMTRLDLEARMTQPWFDATGLILIEDVRGPTPVLAASHWTKVVPTTDPQVTPAEGEVYVVGVDPAYQGVGLGRAVTVLGLEHLIAEGLASAILYVDAENTAAVATYAKLGFTNAVADVMYSRVVHPSVPR